MSNAENRRKARLDEEKSDATFERKRMSPTTLRTDEEGKGPKNLSIQMMLNNQATAPVHPSSTTSVPKWRTENVYYDDSQPKPNTLTDQDKSQRSSSHPTLPVLSSLQHDGEPPKLTSPHDLTSSIYGHAYSSKMQIHSHNSPPYQMVAGENAGGGAHMYPPQPAIQYPLGSTSSQQMQQISESKRGRRFRRRYNQIVRKYKCSYPNCTKSYGSLNHLNTHIATKKHGQRKSKADFQDNTEIPQHSIYQQIPSQGLPVDPNSGSYWYGYPIQGSPYVPYNPVSGPLPAHQPHISPPYPQSSTSLRQPMVPYVNPGQPPPGYVYYPTNPGQVPSNPQWAATNQSRMNLAPYVQSPVHSNHVGMVKHAGSAPSSNHTQHAVHDTERTHDESFKQGKLPSPRIPSPGSSGHNRSKK